MLGSRIKRRTEDDAAGAVLAHHPHHLLLADHALGSVGHEGNVARHLQHLFDADGERSIYDRDTPFVLLYSRAL
jgi:hypothetical protein